MNNLHGWAMNSYLSYGGTEWVKNVDGFDTNFNQWKESSTYLLKVNLEYPDELHALHNNYRLAPEKFAIAYDMLSGYCKKIAEEYGIKVGDVKDVIPNSANKTKYVLHYRDLQLY